MSENRKEEYLKLKLRKIKRLIIVVGCLALVILLLTIITFIVVIQTQQYPRSIVYKSLVFSLDVLTIIVFIIFLLISIRHYMIKKKLDRIKYGLKKEKKKEKRRDLRVPKQTPKPEKQQQSQQVVIQQPSAPTLNNMKSCIHCGNFINTTAKFCEKCGKEQ